ncbi:beta strand repeat-containing protein [candidate division KSB1 bacterium]
MKKQIFSIGWTKLIVFSLLLVLFMSCSESGMVDPTNPTGTIRIKSISTSSETVGIGGETAVITVDLIDGTGDPYQGGVVGFDAVLGSITLSDTSDSEGIAAATYTSGSSTGIDTITATVLNSEQGTPSEEIQITLEYRAQLQISAASTSLLADGAETTELSLLYKDFSGIPVSDQEINLIADFGDIESSVTTDMLGRATAVYTVPASIKDSVAVIYAAVVSSETQSKVINQVSDEITGTELTGKKDNKTVFELPEKSIIPDKNNQQNNLLQKTAAVTAADTFQIELTGIKLSVSTAYDSINATGNTQTSITAILTTASGTPFKSKAISFSTNFGSLVSDEAVTNNLGKASVILQSAEETGVATVTAAYGDFFTSDVYVNFIQGGQESFNITISSNPTSISADGTSSSEMTVILTNSTNNPIQNETVSFSTTLGRIDAEAVTDDIGVATANLYSSRTNGIAIITAEYKQVTKATQVAFTGVQLTVDSEPDRVVADGASKSAITLVLTDAKGNPIESDQVELTASSGTFDNDSLWVRGRTDVNGTFIDSLKNTINDETTISASGGGTTATTMVSFTTYVTSLSPASSSITADDSTLLTYKIQNIGGEGVSGLKVVFFTSLGELNPTEGTTNSSGEAYTYLKSTVGGEATVTASITTSDVVAQPATAIVTISSTPPATLKLIADPIVVAVNGGESELTAIVADAGGNPVPDQIVSFNIVTGPGGGENITPSFATTDNTGSAVTTFKSGSIGSSAPNSVLIKASIQEYSLTAQVNLTIAGEPNEINTSSSPPPTDNQDGTLTLSIGSIVSDINGNPVIDSTLVHYSTSPPIGVIKSPVPTTEGKVSTSLTYPLGTAGDSIAIIVTSGQVKDTLIISQLPTSGNAGFVNDIVFVGSGSESILADGEEETTFKVRVLDNTSNPIEGVSVEFSASPGNSGSEVSEEQILPDGSQNPEWGVATFLLRSVSLENDSFPSVTVIAGGITKVFQQDHTADSQNPLKYLGITLTVETDEDTLDVNETMNVRATLKETTSHIALENRSVSFGSALGSIINEAQTNNHGIIDVDFGTGNVSGNTTITATFGTGISASKSIYIRPYTPEPVTNIYLAADTSLISVKGVQGLQSTRITTRLTDASNSSVGEGIGVSLTSSKGTFASTGNTSVALTTDEDGWAYAQLQSDSTAGIAKITATSGSVIVSKDLVTFQAGNPDTVTVSADTVGVLTEGNLLTINVGAIVNDVNGNPVVSGTPVTFSIEDNDGNPANNPVVSILNYKTTDEFGIVRTVLTYRKADVGKQLRIRATVGGVSATVDITLPNEE